MKRAAAVVLLAVAVTSCGSGGTKPLTKSEQSLVTQLAGTLDKSTSARSLTYVETETQQSASTSFKSSSITVRVDSASKASEDVIEHPLCPGSKPDPMQPVETLGKRFTDYYYSSYPLPAKVPHGEHWTANETQVSDLGPQSLVQVTLESVARLLAAATTVTRNGPSDGFSITVTFNKKAKVVGSLAGATTATFSFGNGYVTRIALTTPATKDERKNDCAKPEIFVHTLTFADFTGLKITRPADSDTLFYDGKKKNYDPPAESPSPSASPSSGS